MERDRINQYDLVEIIRVPEDHVGMIDVGDVGVVVGIYNGNNFEIECVRPGGSYKWLEIVNLEYIRLKSKDPFSSWEKKSLSGQLITMPSIKLGAVIGAIFGALMGAGLGAISMSLNGILIGLVIGLLLGVLTGALTAALTVKTAGTTGGVGVGYFTGMLFGGFFGMVIGMLIPTSWRLSANTEGMPVLDALMMGRLETAIMVSFALSVLSTMVGVWVAGKNQSPEI